jgi:hypothetical protein
MCKVNEIRKLDPVELVALLDALVDEMKKPGRIRPGSDAATLHAIFIKALAH